MGRGVESVTRDDEGLRVVLDDGTEIRPDKLLVASGRMGNTETLDLGAAGVEMDQRGQIIVERMVRNDGAQRCTPPAT